VGGFLTAKETVFNGFSAALKWHKEDETVENGCMRAGPPEHPAEAR
jgi:hypothetical protein